VFLRPWGAGVSRDTGTTQFATVWAVVMAEKLRHPVKMIAFVAMHDVMQQINGPCKAKWNILNTCLKGVWVRC